MEFMKLKDAPLSMRLFLGLFLYILGISYLSLLSGIWIDTKMKIANIAEGYSLFEISELVEHSFKYLSWFISTFGIVVTLFLLTSWDEKLKRFFAVLIPVLIILDMGSMWLIRYSSFFSWQLFVAGFLLALSFFAMFTLIQIDLWGKK